MKSKEEYRQAIDEVQKEESAEKQEEVERSRGSNDAEGMGMDE